MTDDEKALRLFNRALEIDGYTSREERQAVWEAFTAALQERFEAGRQSLLAQLKEPSEEMVDAVLVAFGSFVVDGTPDHDGYGPPYKLEGPWHLIDASRTEPEVNWPGDLVGEFTRWEDANRKRWRLIIRALAAVLGQTPAWRPTHRHRKGGEYRVIARGKLEWSLEDAVTYESRDGEVWVRPAAEFDDGRFTRV